MLKKLTQVSSRSVHINPYWEYRLDEYIQPNGETGDYHYINSRGATIIVPLVNKDQFVLIKQYRYLNSRESIEFPGGGIKEGFSAEKNALAELVEETGFDAASLKELGVYNPYNGVTNELCNVYIAEELTETGKAPDETEQFELLLLTYNEINDLIKKGEIWDGMTLAAWTLYQIYRSQNSKT